MESIERRQQLLRMGLISRFEHADIVESGESITIRTSPTGHFLVSPFTATISNELTERSNIRYLANGFLHYDEEPGGQREWPRSSDEPIRDNARLVTLDPSVWVAGLDASRFEAGEAIFVSAAFAADFVHFFVLVDKERGLPRMSWESWRYSEPVPLDQPVLELARALSREAAELTTGRLSRTDLLCAASALHYGAKLYTTDPGKYDGIGSGLQVAQYGEAPPAPPAPPPSWENTKLQFQRRSLVTRDHIDPLLDDTVPLPDRAYFVIDVFADLRSADDRGWKSAILAVAEQLPFRELDDALRDYVISAVSQAYDEPLIREASDAIGGWGIWPIDASPEVLDELEWGDVYPGNLVLYRSYLLMAGLDTAAADHEIERIERGELSAGREHIESVARSR